MKVTGKVPIRPNTVYFEQGFKPTARGLAVRFQRGGHPILVVITHLYPGLQHADVRPLRPYDYWLQHFPPWLRRRLTIFCDWWVFWHRKGVDAGRRWRYGS